MILDLILLIFIVISVFIGFKKGFVTVIISLVGFILAVFLAFTFKDSVASFVNDKMGFGNTISVGIEDAVRDALIKDSENTEQQNEEKDIKDTNILNNINIFKESMEDIQKSADETRDSKIKELSDSIAMFVLKGICFIGIFIIVQIILIIIKLILNTIVNLPVLKTLNAVGGMGASFILSIFQILVVLAIISFISPLSMVSSVTDLIAKSSVVSFLYNNNFLVSIIANTIL